MVTIVDTSLVIAYLVPESGSAVARTAMLAADVVISSDLLPMEMLNAAANMARRKRAAWPDLEAMLDQVPRLPITLLDHRPQLPAARVICTQTGAVAYDAILIALAEHCGSPLFTLDARLGRTLAGTPWERWVRVIGE